MMTKSTTMIIVLLGTCLLNLSAKSDATLADIKDCEAVANLTELDEITLYAHWKTLEDGSETIKDALGVGSNVTVVVEENWQTGEPSWQVDRDHSYDGNSCVSSTGSGSFSVTVDGPGTLSFVAYCCNANLSASWKIYTGTESWSYYTEYLASYYSGPGYSSISTESIDGASVKTSWTGGWVRFEIEIYGSGLKTVNFSGYNMYGDEAEWCALIDDMSWTPAMESADVLLEYDDGNFLPSQTYQPGDKFGTLPQPIRSGYVFAGWCKDEELTQVVSADDYVPFDGAHLYAKWKKTLALDNENWYESEMTYTTGETVYRTDVLPEDDTSYHSYIDFVVSGPGFFTFWIDAIGYAQYTISVDGEATGLVGAGTGSTLSNWKKQNLTISGLGQHTVRLTATGSYREGVVLAKNASFEMYAAQSTLGNWINIAKNYSCWVTGNLPTLQSKYASDETPKGRVLHALSTLLTLGENTSLQELFKGFGYTIDYMTLHPDGNMDFSRAPAGNTIVDTLIDVGEPLIKTALADLEAIPDSMSPFELTVDECAHLDEGVTIDYGDILYMRTALKGLLGFAYWSKAYNIEIDYNQLIADRSGVALKTVADEDILSTESGWCDIDWLSPYDPGDYKRAPFKAVKSNTSVYVYAPHTDETTVGTVNLCCVNPATRKSFVGIYYDWGEEYSSMSHVAELDDASIFRFDVSKLSDVAIDNVILKKIYANLVTAGGYSYSTANWDADVATTERFLLHQTKIANAIRTPSALMTAREYVKEALQLWKQADEKVTMRTDNSLHLVEYDGHDTITEKNFAAIRRNIPKAIQSLTDGSVQEYEWIDLLEHSHPEKYEGTLADPVKANINKLFTGEFTRSVLPNSVSSDCYVPAIYEMDSTVNGMLPETTKAEVAALLDAVGIAYSNVTSYTFTYDDAGDGTITLTGIAGEQPKGELIIPPVYAGKTVVALTSATLNCTDLTSVMIPSSVTNIDYRSVVRCSGLQSIEVDKDNNYYSSLDGVLFDSDKKNLILYPQGKEGSYTILSSVTCIETGAFGYCNGLTSVTIPEGVTHIGWGTFYACKGLTSMTIPSSMKQIGFWALGECANLNAIDFEGAPPGGIGYAGTEQDAAIRYNVAYEAQWLPVIEECGWTNAQPYQPKPSVPGDPGAVITGDPENGYVIAPSEENTDVVVTIPPGVEPEKVTVVLGTDVETVKPNGANVKIVKGGNDITGYLTVPSADASGKIDLTKAAVKEAVVKGALDPDKGAEIVLNAESPSLTTAETKPGLTYTLHEGATLQGMGPGDSKLGDGKAWSPNITVKGGSSGFYSIGVAK